MHPDLSRLIIATCVFAFTSTPLSRAQVAAPPAAPASTKKIEPGLESAVKWKWWVSPSDEKDWGIPLPEPEKIADPSAPGSTPGSGSPTISIGVRPSAYEVKRGDALAIIARKFSMSVSQLKTFNQLASDTIRVGQMLKIPTPEELAAMAPPPPPPPPAEEAPKKKSKSKDKGPAKPTLSFEATREMENVLLQAFLDREGFPTGPIDGNPGATFEKTLALYRTVHEDVQGAEPLRQKAVNVVGEPFTSYVLKREDFRYIAPPKAGAAPVAPLPQTRSKSKSKGKASIPPLPPPTYDELTSTTHLAYRTAWEFVAERFHCDETFLRNLNFNIKTQPVVGTEFQVPNVVPFEIEKAFDPPVQPEVDETKPVTAAIVDLSRLEVYREGKLIAAMPMSLARPDLRGRGSWTILDVIPRPRLATKQEQKDTPKPKVDPVFNTQILVPETPAAPPQPVLESEQFIAAGPNNPLGIVWINLAKAKSTDPLPYGLHGTSIPSQMKTFESIGGLRLANWDIARAVRLLPKGTPLQWK